MEIPERLNTLTMAKRLDESSRQSEWLRKPFRYSPLDDGHIRLLKLRAGKGRSTVISGELITVGPFEENSLRSRSVPPYETLSYVWGVASAKCHIRINDCQFLIRPNLEAALRALAKQRTESFLLWVDAICINQDDNAEKNLQVRMMKSIYYQAEGVLIWINSPNDTFDDQHRSDDGITLAIKGFARAHKAGRDPKWLAHYIDNPHEGKTKEFNDTSQGAEAENLGKERGNWPAVVNFFDQDWWRRVWIRQEIAMSRRATVICGERSIDWDDVAAIAHWLNLFTSDLDDRTRGGGGRHRSGAYSAEDLQDFRQTLQGGGDLDLQTMLVHARNCEATDPRDKVFAVLGMVADNENSGSSGSYGVAPGPIPVDYNLTPVEVAKQAFRKLALLNEGLDALIFSQNPARKEGIPSWAPDIYGGFSALPSRLEGRSTSLYRATGSRRHDYFHFSADNTLSVNIGIFDFIEEFSLSFPGGMKTSDLDDTMRIFRRTAFQWLENTRIDEKYEMLMRTLTRDRDIRGRRLNSNVDGVDWGRFFRIEHIDVGAKTEFHYLSRAIRQFQAPVDDDAESQAWLHLYSESIGNRRLALTKGGRLGLVPAATNSLDTVCIINGMDVPFVLRKINNTSYILIGEAYIFGAMDGEIVVRPQTIKLE